jgi:4-amino-4-deoxy-L-arabinose transferase-like glycosyltransferase
MLFIALFLWSAERAMRTKRYLDFAWLGLFFGLGMLVKSSVALILPGLAFWSFWTYRSDDFIFKLVKGYALAVLIAGLCMVPWVARNYAVSGQFVPTMTVGGLALFQGSHVVKSLGSGKNHADVLEDAAREQTKIARELKLRVHDGFFPQFYNTTDELIYYSELGRRAWSEYMNSPLLMASAITYNCWAFWFQGRSSTSTWFNLTLTLPLLVLVALGINLARRNRVDITIPVVVAACFIAPHLLILSMARYHVPLLPVLCLFAAYPIAGFSSRLLSSRCSMPMTLSSAGFKSRRSHGNDAG